MLGRIVKSQSGFFWVETDAGIWMSRLRGRLKRKPLTGDVAAVGDQVEVTPLERGQGVIEAVLPRKRMFSRLAPNPQGVYEQVILANPDQAVFIFACADPAPRLGMLDRFLVIAEKGDIPVIIVANKVDLIGIETAQEMFSHYPPLGYEVIYTSVRQKLGVDQLRERLVDKVSFFTGPSGVGKSSLLNEIQPGLGLAAREISQATSKGRHTTVVRELFKLEGGGYVADTPGIKALALFDIEPEELDGYFPELRDLVDECQFSDCTHVHEPGCAVLAAVEAGKVHPERYRSYLRMRFGDEE